MMAVTRARYAPRGWGWGWGWNRHDAGARGDGWPKAGLTGLSGSTVLPAKIQRLADFLRFVATLANRHTV